jgi:hypothetical protein
MNESRMMSHHRQLDDQYRALHTSIRALFLFSISNELKIELFRSFTLSLFRLVKLMRLRELHISIYTYTYVHYRVFRVFFFRFTSPTFFPSPLVHLYNGMSMHHQFCFCVLLYSLTKDNNDQYITNRNQFDSSSSSSSSPSLINYTSAISINKQQL